MTMYPYQDSLPPLPVPALEATTRQYLDAIKPLLPADAYRRSEELVAAFLAGAGPVLQEKLVRYREELGRRSWLYDYTRERFLARRAPLSFTGHFTLELEHPAFSERCSYLKFAAMLAHSVGKAYLGIANGTLAPMVVQGRPLCMSQLRMLLGAARTPMEIKDTYEIYEPVSQVDSFGVFYRNHFYVVRLLRSDGTLEDCRSIWKALLAIAATERPVLDVNFNTASFAGSTTATAVLETLKENKASCAALAEANRTMFNLALKPVARDAISFDELVFSDAADLYLYKPLSLTVYQDKRCTLHVDHTFVDGISIVHLCTVVLDEMQAMDLETERPSEQAPFKALSFALSDPLRQALRAIRADYIREAHGFCAAEYGRSGIGFEKAKSLGIGSDALTQIGFHYAGFKTYGAFRSTHESVSVAHFFQGRTSCLRSVSEESVRFVRALDDGEMPSNRKLALLQEASKRHHANVRNAKDFVCFVRHSAGLLSMLDLFGAELGLHAVPDVFLDQSFKKYRIQEVSTSGFGNVSFLKSFAFPPVAEGGLGLGYLVDRDALRASLTCHRIDQHAAAQFATELDRYFDIVETLLEVAPADGSSVLDTTAGA